MSWYERDPRKGPNGALAAVFRSLKAIRGLNYRELSQMSGIGRPTLMRRFTAQRAISVAEFVALCRAFDMSTDEVLLMARNMLEAMPADGWVVEDEGDDEIVARQRGSRG